MRDNPDAKVVDGLSDGGASTYHGRHLKDDFGRMFQNIQNGKYLSGQTVLLVEPETRLNRQKTHNIENLVNLITSEGIDVICFESGKIYTSTNIDSFNTSIQLKITAHTAHQQSKEKSTKADATWGNRAQLVLEGEQQLTKNVPGWVDPDTRKLNEHSPTVVTIFDLLPSGGSLHNIVRYLQANDIKSLSRREKANGFSVHFVRAILRSESTVGTLAASEHNDRPVIPNYYESAADVATSNKAQEILSKNRAGRVSAGGNPITINLLKGIIRCRYGVSVHPTGVRATYQGVYRCNDIPSGHYNVPTVKYKPFGKWVSDNIADFLERDDGNSTDKREVEIEYQISLVASKLEKATTLLLELDNVTELKEQVKELNTQRNNLQSELDELNQRETLSDKPLHHLSKIDLTTKAGRVGTQPILSEFVRSVELQRKMIIITFRSGTVIGRSGDLSPVLSQDLMK